MTLDWASFTPGSAALGGAMIGLGVAMLVFFNGRVAGVSGILGGLLRPQRGDVAWQHRIPRRTVARAPRLRRSSQRSPAITIAASYPTLILAGLLISIGSRYGSGCTSGHGVCGLSRLSPRSLVATLVFMGAGFATIFVASHVIG